MNPIQPEDTKPRLFEECFGVTPEQSIDPANWARELDFDISSRATATECYLQFCTQFGEVPDLILLTRHDSMNLMHFSHPDEEQEGPPNAFRRTPFLAHRMMNCGTVASIDLKVSKIVKLVKPEPPLLADFLKSVKVSQPTLSYAQEIGEPLAVSGREDAQESNSVLRFSVGPMLLEIVTGPRFPAIGEDVVNFVGLNGHLYERVADLERVKFVAGIYSKLGRKAPEGAVVPPDVPGTEAPDNGGEFTRAASDSLPLVEWRLEDFLAGEPLHEVPQAEPPVAS